jgi:hypothetical protein
METIRSRKDLQGTLHQIRREQDLLSAFRWKDLPSALRNIRRSPMAVDEQREEHPEEDLEVEAVKSQQT